MKQSALERWGLLSKVIASEQIDAMLALVDSLAASYDVRAFHQAAGEANIDLRALEYLGAPERRTPYPYYFCLPVTLVAHPQLVFYYRNVALLSAEVMRLVGLDTQAYEIAHIPPTTDTARELARYFNGITGNLVLAGGVTPYRHIEMMMANLSDSLLDLSQDTLYLESQPAAIPEPGEVIIA